MGLRIIRSLVDQVPLRLILTDNFQGQIGTKPKAVLPARVRGHEEQHEIRLAELARSRLEPQGSKLHVAALGLEEMEKGNKKELQKALMLIGRHGEHFQIAVGEFNQSVPMVGKNKVLFVAPYPLGRKDVREQILPFGGRRMVVRESCWIGHAGSPREKGKNVNGNKRG